MEHSYKTSPLPIVTQDPSPRWRSNREEDEVDHFSLGVCIWESDSSSDSASIFDHLPPQSIPAPAAIILPPIHVSISAERSNEEEENQEDEDDEHCFVEDLWISKSPPDDSGDSDGSVSSEENNEDDEKDDESSSEGVPSLSQYFWNSDDSRGE